MRLIRCECGCQDSEHECGWQAHLVDLDHDGEDEVACFCPLCAAREFGIDSPARHGE